MSSTVLELSAQWASPSDISTVLMVIGGDVVQKALAQATGKWLSPVCFSFGWVSYTFMALVAVLGDGRLLPAPDHPVRVFNLTTGNVRDNRHWGLGRVVRDHERALARDMRYLRSGNDIWIVVFEATASGPRSPNSLPWGWTHFFGLSVMVVQVVIAAVPWFRSGDWGVFFVTASATALALTFGALPQWIVETLPNRQHSQAVYALTSGNGARDIMIIKGMTGMAVPPQANDVDDVMLVMGNQCIGLLFLHRDVPLKSVGGVSPCFRGNDLSAYLTLFLAGENLARTSCSQAIASLSSRANATSCSRLSSSNETGLPLGLCFLHQWRTGRRNGTS